MNKTEMQCMNRDRCLTTSVLAMTITLLACTTAYARQRTHLLPSRPAQFSIKRTLVAANETAKGVDDTADKDAQNKAEKKGFLNKVMSVTGLAKPQPAEEPTADAGKKTPAQSDKPKPAAAPTKASADHAAKAPAPNSVIHTQTTTITRTVQTQGDAQMDSALLSVLRDISKALKENEDIGKLEDPAQKTAMAAAIQALDTALGKTDGNPNRIIEPSQKERFEKSLTAEAWESGNIAMPNNCHASLNVLWAKKINGLVNISVTGTGSSGEFVVVINGKSALDSGFDIQSQSNVSYWIGKLTNFTVDADNASAAKVSTMQMPLLHALLTEQNRKRAAVAAEPPAPSTEPGSTEATPPTKKPEAAGAAVALVPAVATTADNVPPPPSNVPEPARGGAQKPAPSPAAAPLPPPVLPAVTAQPPVVSTEKPAAVIADQVAVLPPAPPAPKPSGSALQAAPTAPGAAGAQAAPATPRVPPADALLLVPDHAVAGDYITVCVLSDHQHKAEARVELSFNGAAVVTSTSGQASFPVPEELPPGPSLLVTMSARPEMTPVAVEVLQPLLRPTGPQVPRIDRVSKLATVGSTIIIDGHNFDGLAERDHVKVDGTHEARILVASPVQIKALLPSSLPAGQHSVLVTSNGLRSNTTPCTLIAAKVEPALKNGKRKLACVQRKHKNHRRLRVAARHHRAL